MTKPDSQESKYWKLMSELKQKIVDGTYQSGDKMPSENELAVVYQVSRHTVRKALAILEHEGYIYAVHGKGTFCSEMGRHTKTSRNIAVVTTYLSDYIFPSVIQGIDQVMTENGYSIILKNTKNSSSAEGKCLEELLSKDIEGLIIEPSKSEIYCRHIALYKKLDEFHIPYVFIQGTMEQLSDRPYVMMDDFKGGYLITKYLLSLGHRKILGMFKADDRQGIERHRGYAKALQEYGVFYDPDRIIWFHTEDRAVKPFARLRAMAASGIKFDSVVCYNDQIAYGVIDLLQKHNVRVPEDVLVIGFDDSSISEYSPVKITSFVHPKVEMGRAAANKLIHMLRSSDPEQPLVLDMPLHEKESTRR